VVEQSKTEAENVREQESIHHEFTNKKNPLNRQRPKESTLSASRFVNIDHEIFKHKVTM